MLSATAKHESTYAAKMSVLVDQAFQADGKPNIAATGASVSTRGLQHDRYLPTMFWTLKSMNFAGNPSFCTTRANFLAANLASSSDFDPVTTIFPDAKMRAVDFGSLIRIITAENR